MQPMQGTPPVAHTRPASQESLLLDYLSRLERHRADRRAAYLRLSALQTHNRREQHVRMTVGAFDDLVKMLQAQAFSMSNGDLMVIYKSQAQDEVEAAIVKLRFLFSDDPLIANENVGSGGAFCAWYDLAREYDDLVAFAQNALAEEQAKRRTEQEVAGRQARFAERPKGSPFTPELLVRVEAALGQADLANLVRRQAICAVVGNATPQPVFHELFISIADLRQTLMPNVNMNSSPWLFQQLTETLDRRVLSLLNKHDDRTLEGDISINLNVSTLLSPEFLVFDDNIKAGMRGTIVLELQKVDIMADLGAYLFARDFAHDRGYRICIDGLTYSTLPFVDRERLGADLIKLIWDPSLTEERDKKTAALRRIGATRIILARCDTPSAIEYGHSVGITLFQGRHIEQTLMNDMRRKGIGRARGR
jgi:EAL domain-containing protein (putative c-di-GMP-specific phosphodiesterase class I)